MDSGERHSVGGSAYSSVRIAAFMGLRIATQAYKEQQALRGQQGQVASGGAGMSAEQGRQTVDPGHPPPIYGGYLANIAPSALFHSLPNSR